MSEPSSNNGGTSFLFWNTAGKPVEKLVLGLVRNRKIDVLMLAECAFDRHAFASELAEGEQHSFAYVDAPVERPERNVAVFTRVHAGEAQLLAEDDGASFYRLPLRTGDEILLVAVHLRSKLFISPELRLLSFASLAHKIETYEQTLGHHRTALVGDLNANPFEPGVAYAGYLNGVMDAKIAEQGSRRARGKNFPFFYNPMWSCFGDFNGRPPGTYFHRDETFLWNMYDQVLLRPELLTWFPKNSLEIVTQAGEESLVAGSGRPDKSAGVSDHLPVAFRLSM